MFARYPSRLAIGVLIVQILTSGILIWYSTHLASAHHRQWLLESARQQSTLLADALVPRLLSEDHRDLLNTLEYFRSNRVLRYAAVFDSRRELLASLGDPPPLVQNLEGSFRYRQIWEQEVFRIEYPIISQGRSLGVLQMGYTLTQVNDLTRTVGIRNIVIALLGLLLSTGLMVLSMVLAKRGLARLETGLQRFRNGQLNYRIPDTAQALSPVVKTLNSLVEELESKRIETRNQYDKAFQESRRLNNLLQGIHAVVWEADPATGCFQYMGAEIEHLSGHAAGAWLAADFLSRYVHPSDLAWLQDFLGHAASTVDTFNLDFRLFNQDRETIWLRLISTVEIRDLGSVLTGLLLNVSEEKRNEQWIAYLADHDPLTGLINRRCFQEKLEQQVAHSRRYNTQGVLLLMDLDRFRDINDSYGHQAGDEYLRQVAHYLRNLMRETSTVGRLDGDKFGVILPNVETEEAERVSDAVLETLCHQDFIHQDQRVRFSASIGFVLFPEQGSKAGELVVKADSALYAARGQGGNAYRSFKGSMDTVHMQEKTRWDERIRAALEENRFRLYFQPVVDLYTGMISHYECLVRMCGDDGELIPPASFIGIAEYLGAVRDIDRWVVANAIRVQSETEHSGHSKALAINLSGQHFGGREILETIEESTWHYRIKPGEIIFEINETDAVERYEEACHFIQLLRDMGYRIALDNFGAGLSSFSYLKQLPVDYVKIDGSFVRNLTHDRVSRVFVTAITEMVKGLGGEIIAESVESVEVLDVLRDVGITLGQGYLFAEPGPGFRKQGRITLPG